MTGNCIYLKKPFEVGAKEHILQAALGAHWKDGNVISPEANSKFADMDAKLVGTIHPLRTLLGAKGERGAGSDLKNIKDGEGRKYSMRSGGDYTLSEPFVNVEIESANSAKVSIEIPDEKQAGWAAVEIEKKLKLVDPNWQLDRKLLAEKIAESGERIRERNPSPLRIENFLGGDLALRAVVKSAFNLLGVNAPEIASSDCFDEAREFILNGLGKSEDFIRWGTVRPLKRPKLGPVDHFLAVWSFKKKVFAYCQLYGVLIHPIRLATNYTGEKFSFSYVVDPLREASIKEQKNVGFDQGSMPRFNEAESGNNGRIRRSLQRNWTPVIQLSKLRMVESEIERIVNDVLLPHEGQLITEEISQELHFQLMSFITTLFTVPSTK